MNGLLSDMKAIIDETFDAQPLSLIFSHEIPNWLEAKLDVGLDMPPSDLHVDQINVTPWTISITKAVPDYFDSEQVNRSTTVAKFFLDQLGVGTWRTSRSTMLGGYDNTTGTPRLKRIVRLYCILRNTRKR